LQLLRLLRSSALAIVVAGAFAAMASAAPVQSAHAHSAPRSSAGQLLNSLSTVAPTVALVAQPPVTTSSTSATIAWTEQGGLTTTCSKDSTAAFACVSPVTLTGLSRGAHTFAVRVANLGGSARAAASWTTTAATQVVPPPSVAIASGPVSPTTSTSATLTFAAANATSLSCSLDGAAATACVGSITYPSVAIGAHTFTVLAASGVLSASALFTWSVIGLLPVANAWVDSDGGTCPNSSAPVVYNDATACSSFQAALTALPAAGGTILVKCGIYAPQTVSAGKAGMTTISSETGRCATIEAAGAIAVTLGNGVSNLTLDSLTINGMTRGTTTTGVGNSHIVMSRNFVNVGKKVNGPSINFYVGDYISITGNTIGPSCCGFNSGHGVSPEGIRIGKPSLAPATCTTQVCHLVIDNNTIQSVVRDCALWPTTAFGACPDTSCPNSVGCHEDGIHIWGVDGGAITRNRVYGVECQAIFLENANASLQRNVSIVNNAISSVAGGCGNKGIYLSAGGKTDGATYGFAGSWIVAFNSGAGTLIGPNGCGSCWPGTTFQLVGNDMPLFATSGTGNSAGCATPWGVSTVAYRYNVWRSGATNTACGPNDTLANPAFVNQVSAPAFGNDLHLGAPGAADNYVPAAVCAAITSQDFDGQSRSASASCDAGADER